MTLSLDRSAWTRVALGHVASASKEKADPADGAVERYVAGEHMDTDNLDLSRWGDVGGTDLGPAFHRRFRPGQVLYGSRRTYLRKVAVAEFDGVCANTTFVVAPDDPLVLLPEFLPFIMSSEPFHAFAIAESKGSVNPYVNWSDIARYEFLLPPLGEQQRIAVLLWALERHKRALVRLRETTQIAAAVLIEDAKMRASGTIMVREVARVHNGQIFPRELQGRSAGDVPFFKVADLDGEGNERFLTNPGNWISRSEAQGLGAEVLPVGTVVTARVGAAIKLERRRALRRPALVDDNHLVIRPTSVDPDFLLAILSETALAMNSNDGVVPSLNQQIVGAVTLPYVEHEEEERIGANYQGILNARDQVTHEHDALTQLCSSMLANIFGGA